eukprot:CAMPEP_0176193202 /NCGR_PEP_ID=MMETSP0121_2-20121125/5363_1 /TAXON_ID=160619 /ORGANISM="Kryptoperidinium foliaceum, Strain CCMP 1326" /LENGTH=96 /DNA_ID=CAMNT_0017531909 /DNA_START=129 /DNA_END=419 /DNA_ORIENTATION=-
MRKRLARRLGHLVAGPSAGSLSRRKARAHRSRLLPPRAQLGLLMYPQLVDCRCIGALQHPIQRVARAEHAHAANESRPPAPMPERWRSLAGAAEAL